VTALAAFRRDGVGPMTQSEHVDGRAPAHPAWHVQRFSSVVCQELLTDPLSDPLRTLFAVEDSLEVVAKVRWRNRNRRRLGRVVEPNLGVLITQEGEAVELADKLDIGAIWF
jgi:hypothetical protein